MSAKATQSLRKNGDAVTRTIAGETLLVPIRGRLADLRQIFSLNPVAACVWESIDGARDIPGLAREVAAVFDVDQEQAVTDVRRFVQQLVDAGLVVGPDESAEPAASVSDGGLGGTES